MLLEFQKEKLVRINKAFAQEQPNVNATYLYDSDQMVLGNDIKHLILLIRNEGYHGAGEADESKFISQMLSPLTASGNLRN
jgi:hypothetical protein